MWKWNKNSEHLYLQTFNKRNKERRSQAPQMKLQKRVFKIVPILAVTQKKAMGSLKVNSREIQIAGGFSQDLGETGLRYQPPRPTLPPTPSPQLHPLIFSFSWTDLTLRGGMVGLTSKAVAQSWGNRVKTDRPVESCFSQVYEQPDTK